MVDFITKIKKVSLSVISLSLLTAMSCGIIDTEQVTDIIEKQQEVERIRAERIDPLLDQIGLIDEETIEPIEKQIRDLERQRDELYRTMEETEGQKIDEIEAMYREIKMQERALEDELRQLDDQNNLQQVERRQMEQGFVEQWTAMEMDVREIQIGLEEFNRSRVDDTKI